MDRINWVLPLAAILFLPADTLPWQKSAAQWDASDAKQVLEDSPWAKMVPLQHVRYLSAAERRDSGNWQVNIGPGVGLAALEGILDPSAAAEAVKRAHQFGDLGSVTVRWESALPVRTAHDKLGVEGAGRQASDYYILAVYGIKAPKRWNVANELKGIASLRRVKKKDLKPSHVDILRTPDGLSTVVYLFRRSEEITSKDRVVQFVAQIGEFFIVQNFSIEEMKFQDRLEM